MCTSHAKSWLDLVVDFIPFHGITGLVFYQVDLSTAHFLPPASSSSCHLSPSPAPNLWPGAMADSEDSDAKAIDGGIAPNPFHPPKKRQKRLARHQVCLCVGALVCECERVCVCRVSKQLLAPDPDRSM